MKNNSDSFKISLFCICLFCYLLCFFIGNSKYLCEKEMYSYLKDKYQRDVILLNHKKVGNVHNFKLRTNDENKIEFELNMKLEWYNSPIGKIPFLLKRMISDDLPLQIQNKVYGWYHSYDMTGYSSDKILNEIKRIGSLADFLYQFYHISKEDYPELKLLIRRKNQIEIIKYKMQSDKFLKFEIDHKFF